MRVPATSANLGPGFDALGLALSCHDDIVVRAAESGLVIDVAGEGSDTVPRNGRHLLVRALRATFDRLGGQPRGLEVVCANRIPHGRGLGSSAAAIVAGVVAAKALVAGGGAPLDAGDVLRLCTELEGHPDNVAACLLGGLTVAWRDGEGPHAIPLTVSGTLAPVVFVPGTRSSTAKARRLLPAQVPHADAAHSAGRAALLVEALARRPELLLSATEDHLHQAYRASAMPTSAKLVARLRDRGVPAVISGAGPSVLALTTAATREAVAALAPRGFTALQLDIDRSGAEVLPLG
ncbi:MAG TPA: homoserine kinase [Mycobacteriales bacterium]|nr:homoserine kinase [Mycobacteriales bacterium]